MEVILNNLTFSYSKNNVILDDITIKFEEGKITSIIGKSGSGKTTLAELMTGLLKPTSGQIIINNKIVNEEKDNINEIGLVFQFPEEQFFNLTVFDEISFGLKYYKYKLDELKNRVVDSLKMVGLDESYLEVNPFVLSDGEKRKVAIASILVLNPKVLILDEPTIGLDSISKKNLIKIIRKLKIRYGKTIIIISHDMDFVNSITDYIYVLNAKKIYMTGKKIDVFKEVDKLKQVGIKVPKVIEFSDIVRRKKNIRLGYRDDINDLIKDIYRNAR